MLLRKIGRVGPSLGVKGPALSVRMNTWGAFFTSQRWRERERERKEPRVDS